MARVAAAGWEEEERLGSLLYGGGYLGVRVWRGGLAVDLGRRSRRSVTRAQKVREEGDGADRRARWLSESDARAGGERRLTRGAQLADGAGRRRGTRAGDAAAGAGACWAALGWAERAGPRGK